MSDSAFEVWPVDEEGWRHAVYTESKEIMARLRALKFQRAADYWKQGRYVGSHFLGNKAQLTGLN